MKQALLKVLVFICLLLFIMLPFARRQLWHISYLSITCPWDL